MINDDIVKLHELRKQLATAKNLWSAKAAQFDIDNKELKESAASLAQQVTIAEAELRKGAIEIYTGNFGGVKSVAPGVKIQDTAGTDVKFDEKDALTFAKEKDMFLKLDDTAFKLYALTAPEPPEFVEIIPVRNLKATIAVDLYKACLEIEEIKAKEAEEPF